MLKKIQKNYWGLFMGLFHNISSIKRLINNAYVYSVIAKVISVLTGFLYSILYSRYLGAELRGTASVIINNSDLIMLILCLGIYQAYPYFKKRAEESIYMEYINYVFGLFFLYVIGCIAIGIICRPSAQNCIVLALIPLMFAAKELNYVVLIENPRLRNTANIILDIFDIVFITVLMVFTKATFALCAMFLIVKYLVCFIIGVANLKVNVFTIRPTLRGVWPYIRFGFVPMLTVIMMEINYKADVLMLDYFGIAKAEIGVYSLGVSLAQRVWLIPDALKDILLSKLAGGKDSAEVSKISRISFLMTILFILGLFLLGKPFVWLVYGDEYSSAYYVILVISLGILGMVFYKMVYSYNVINGYKNTNFALLGSAAFLNVVVNAFLIPSYGILGAAAASTVSYLICGIGFLLFFSHKTRISIFDMTIIKKSDINQLKTLIGGHAKSKE